MTSPLGEFEDSGAEEHASPLLPPDDRLWRHPSELADISPTDLDPAVVRSRWLANEPSRASAWSAGFVGALLAAGIVLVGAHLATVFTTPPLASNSVLTASVTTTMPLASPNLGAQMTTAIERIGRSLAVIDSSLAGTSPGMRALGIVISADGTVLTAASAVRDETTVLIELPGTGVVSVGHVICIDTASGLALLHVATDTPLQPLTFSGTPMSAPSFAVAVTSPGSVGVSPQISLGSLERLNVSAASSSDTLMDVDTTDMSASAIPPGTPLLSTSGTIEAVVTGSLNGNAVVTPGWLAGPVTAELLAHSSIQHGWIGVAGADVSNTKGHVRGVLVRGVQAGSAAAAAGLVSGDTIVALEGQRLTSMSQLRGRLYVLGAGTKVRLTVVRGGLRRNVIVALSIRRSLVAAAR